MSTAYDNIELNVPVIPAHTTLGQQRFAIVDNERCNATTFGIVNRA